MVHTWLVVMRGTESPKQVDVTGLDKEQRRAAINRLEAEYPGYHVEMCASSNPDADPVKLLLSW